MEYVTQPAYDPDVPIRPIFVRGASFKSEAVWETPPPPGSTLETLKEMSEKTEESTDLEGFSILTPTKMEKLYSGRCFHDDGSNLSPRTPELEDGDSDTIPAPTSTAGVNYLSPATPEIVRKHRKESGKRHSGGFLAEEDEDDMENWDLDVASLPSDDGDVKKDVGHDDGVVVDYSMVPKDESPPVVDTITSPTVANQIDSTDGDKSPMINVNSPWTDAKINLMMKKIDKEDEKKKQDALKMQQLELEMEAELERSRLEKQLKQESLQAKAVDVYNSQVSKAVRRASMSSGSRGITPIPEESVSTGPSPMLKNEMSYTPTNLTNAMQEEPLPVKDFGATEPVVLTPTPHAAQQNVEPTVLTPTPRTSMTGIPVDRQKQLELEMEEELERSRLEKQQKQEVLQAETVNVYNNEVAKATRRASKVEPVLNTPKSSTPKPVSSQFDDFSLTPEREDSTTISTTTNATHAALKLKMKNNLLKPKRPTGGENIRNNTHSEHSTKVNDSSIVNVSSNATISSKDLL